jgi:mannosyltransferase OCH1-like enzyme
MIPKNIIQYWDGVAADDVCRLMESWVQRNPDFKYVMYDRTMALTYLEKNHDDEVVQSFLSARFPAMASDIFRVAWCLKEGGIYVDAATRCLAPLSGWLPGEASVVLMRKWHGGVWNGFIGAEPSAPLLKEVLGRVVSNVLMRAGNNIWEVTGPGVWISSLQEGTYVKIIPQAELARCFELVNDLSHKGDSHWSRLQLTQSIYLDPP